MTDYDITLGGQGFMVVPGSYLARQDGSAELPVARERLLEEFAAGLIQARDGLASGSGGWWTGAGVGPGPLAQAVSGTIASAEPKLALSDGGYLFIAAGTTLYRWNRAVGSAPASRKTLPAGALCMTRLNDSFYIGFGAGADVAAHDDATNTLTASALGAGVKATKLWTFANAVVLVGPGYPATLHVYYGSSLGYARNWKLDGRILNACQHEDRLIVATDAGLHVLTGSWYQDVDPPAPPETLRLTSWGTLSGALQDSDDFSWMLVHDGQLLAWLGKQVMVRDEPRGRWLPLGLAGEGTSGAAVVNGRLYLTLRPHGTTGRWQLWSWDGSGWWLHDEVTTTNTLHAPAADGAGKLVAFRESGTTLRAWDPDDTTTPATLASPLTLVSAPFDGGEPDRTKRFRHVGVELARGDGQPVGSWTLAVEHSTDGGTTWSSSGAPATVSDERASLEYALVATGRELRLRLTLTRVSGLPPLITAIWVEHETASAPRRRWTLRVRARDRGITRSGALDPRSGQQIRTALWSLWQAATPFAFRDVDYDADPTERSVRLIAIREEWPKPADQGPLGAETLLEVTLVET